MKRIYFDLIKYHLNNWDQMVFIEGPRQVGKTTLAKKLIAHSELNIYYNWDNLEDRKLIVSGQNFIESTKLFNTVTDSKPIIIFDEIHKLPNWKNYLKGFYDTYKDQLKIIATGSSKLSLFKKGQDSLMGRYFSYNVHPLSLAEINTNVDQRFKTLINTPVNSDPKICNDLMEFGGFPDPYIHSSKIFYNNWSKLRFEQLFKEDIISVEDIKNISKLELLAYILTENSSQQINFSNLANKIQISDQTIRKWMTMLENFYFGFLLKPWSTNIARSILKEPKFYLWDWSPITNEGSKIESLIAVHLKKAVSFWNDSGKGSFDLYYLRTKDNKEVDFIVTKNNEPWFLVEVKKSPSASLNKNLAYFQEQTGAKHAFQVVFDMDYIDKNCFEYTKPIIVPAKTFLSQLV